RKYPRYPQAVLAYPNLGALSKLYVNFSVIPIYDGYGRGAATCASNLTKGSVVFAISLSSSGGQTLFYQIILRTFNQPSLTSAFFHNSNPFGWNDSLDNYGYDR